MRASRDYARHLPHVLRLTSEKVALLRPHTGTPGFKRCACAYGTSSFRVLLACAVSGCTAITSNLQSSILSRSALRTATDTSNGPVDNLLFAFFKSFLASEHAWKVTHVDIAPREGSCGGARQASAPRQQETAIENVVLLRELRVNSRKFRVTRNSAKYTIAQWCVHPHRPAMPLSVSKKRSGQLGGMGWGAGR